MSVECWKIANNIGVSGSQWVKRVSLWSNVKTHRIMFTVGNVDRYIGRRSGRHSIDTRSILARYSIDTRSSLGRLPIASRPTGD